jgi:adenylate cyclase
VGAAIRRRDRLRSRPHFDERGRPVPAVAVLPFANLSGDPAQDYFAVGFSEEILNALGRERSLRVIGGSGRLARPREGGSSA